MDQRSPSYEASLLFEAPSTSNPALLAEDIRDIVVENGLPIRQIRAMDGIFLQFDCGAVQLLLAFCPNPLPVEHFLEAARPLAGTASDQVILRKLTRATAHLTVLVLDHPNVSSTDAPTPAYLKHDLCQQITEYLTGHTAPDLVFWAANDTLYTSAEFRRWCDFWHAQVPDPVFDAPDPHAHLRADPVLAPEAATWFDPQTEAAIAAHTPSSVAPDLMDAKIERLARRNTALGLARITKGWSPKRTLRGLAMACTGATIGLSGLPGVGLF